MRAACDEQLGWYDAVPTSPERQHAACVISIIQVPVATLCSDTAEKKLTPTPLVYFGRYGSETPREGESGVGGNLIATRRSSTQFVYAVYVLYITHTPHYTYVLYTTLHTIHTLYTHYPHNSGQRSTVVSDD